VRAPLLVAFFYDPSPRFGADPTLFILMMVAGFVIAVAGHVVRARSLVALGIGLIFLATFVLPLLSNLRASS
jgi:hypothetical protein